MKLNEKKIRLCMARNLLNGSALASKSGIADSTLSRILNGNECKEITAGKLAVALGVDVSEIVREV